MKGNQFNNFLTLEQAVEGIDLALNNAKGLLDDSIFLFDNQRYERAVALAILAIEEFGKISIIRMIILESDIKDVGKLWKEYRQHISKTKSWIFPDLVAKGARHLIDFNEMMTDKTHTQLLETLKQHSLYTDSYKNCQWKSPSQIIDKDIAEMIIVVARRSIQKDKHHLTTAPELEIWVKHLKPIWKQNMRLMSQALLECYIELEQKGLVRNGSSEDMKEFLSPRKII